MVTIHDWSEGVAAYAAIGSTLLPVVAEGSNVWHLRINIYCIAAGIDAKLNANTLATQALGLEQRSKYHPHNRQHTCCQMVQLQR